MAMEMYLHSDFDHDIGHCMYCGEGPHNKVNVQTQDELIADLLGAPQREEQIPCCEDCDTQIYPDLTEVSMLSSSEPRRASTTFRRGR